MLQAFAAADALSLTTACPQTLVLTAMGLLSHWLVSQLLSHWLPRGYVLHPAGMAMVELLRQLERRAGAPIWTLFDVIGGTSTGGLLAVGLGILRLSLDECQDIYTKLGNKVTTARGGCLFH